MRSTAWLAAAILVVLALAGCGKNLEKAVVGTWKMEINTSGMAAGKDKEQAEMAKGMMGQMSMELKEDKSVAIKIMGMEQKGTWSLEGDKITITQGQGGAPMNGTVNRAGDRIELTPPPGQEQAMKGAKVELVKQAGN